MAGKLTASFSNRVATRRHTLSQPMHRSAASKLVAALGITALIVRRLQRRRTRWGRVEGNGDAGMTWTAALGRLFAAYALLTAVYIVLENRRPQATLAWMLVLFSLPGLGLLVYVLVGRDRKAFAKQGKLLRQDPEANAKPPCRGSWRAGTRRSRGWKARAPAARS